jgi:2-furoyl-CoA dehydrogenase large subunit
LRAPGVRAVLTREDVKAWAAPFVVGVKQPMQHWPLAMDRVRYAGEPVAVVVAENRALAEDALDLVQVDYRPQPVAMTIEDALAPDAALLHPAIARTWSATAASATATPTPRSPRPRIG